MMKETPRYRTNVAAFVLNTNGLMLACRRADRFRSWQIPQGGVDAGETLEQAILRELEEEIGTRDLTIVGRLEESIRYDWPPDVRKGGFCGQEQFYFLVRLKPGASINLHAHQNVEFDAAEWVTLSEFLKRVDGFKAAAYTEAAAKLAALFPDAFASDS